VVNYGPPPFLHKIHGHFKRRIQFFGPLPNRQWLRPPATAIGFHSNYASRVLPLRNVRPESPAAVGQLSPFGVTFSEAITLCTSQSATFQMQNATSKKFLSRCGPFRFSVEVWITSVCRFVRLCAERFAILYPANPNLMCARVLRVPQPNIVASRGHIKRSLLGSVFRQKAPSISFPVVTCFRRVLETEIRGTMFGTPLSPKGAKF